MTITSTRTVAVPDLGELGTELHVEGVGLVTVQGRWTSTPKAGVWGLPVRGDRGRQVGWVLYFEGFEELHWLHFGFEVPDEPDTTTPPIRPYRIDQLPEARASILATIDSDGAYQLPPELTSLHAAALVQLEDEGAIRTVDRLGQRYQRTPDTDSTP